MDKQDQQQNQQIDAQQKLIQRITRLAGLGFLAFGVLTFVMGGDTILGSVLVIIGITDIVLVPRFLETIILEKLKHRNDKGQ